MNKFKVGDKVKWNDGKYHHDDKRIDVIIEVGKGFMGTYYITKETNQPKGQKAKMGKACEEYLVLAKSTGNYKELGSKTN